MCGSLVPRKTHSSQLSERGLVLGNIWAATGCGNIGKKQGGSIYRFCLSGWLCLSLSLVACMVSLLGIPFSTLAWFILCIRERLQILKESASLIWLTIISPLGKELCGSLARLRNESGAYPVYSMTTCLGQGSPRTAFPNNSIITRYWVCQAPCLICFRILWSVIQLSSWFLGSHSHFLTNKGNIS